MPQGDTIPASLSGMDAANYALDSVGTTTANITAVTLTASIIGNPTKTYDGNTNATLTAANFSLTGVVTGESITVTKTAGTYNTKDVLTANTITTSLASGDFSPGTGTLQFQPPMGLAIDGQDNVYVAGQPPG